MERSSERALYTARTNTRLPVIPPHLPSTPPVWPTAEDAPPPSTAVSPTPQLSPHLTQVSIYSYWAPQSNQCCGSGMFIPDPRSRILIFTHPGSQILDPGSLIPDPGSKNSNKREKVLKKKIWANFQRIIELFTKKIVKKLLKIWSWDPGSGIPKKPIPDPGSRIQGSKSTQSRIPDPDPQHCVKVYDSPFFWDGWLFYILLFTFCYYFLILAFVCFFLSLSVLV